MITSMTGYGQVAVNTRWGRLSCEVKTVNNRFLEIQAKIPRLLASAESSIRKEIPRHLPRGSVFVNVFLMRSTRPATQELEWDRQAISARVRALRKIQRQFKLTGDLTIDTVARFTDLSEKDPPPLDEKKAWTILRKPFLDAVAKAVRMRKREGKKLETDLKKRLAQCATTIQQIEKRAPARLKTHQERLRTNVQELVGDSKLDPNRMAAEIAMMAERMDITEECVRVRSHLKEFTTTIHSKGPKGKRLNFLVQELNRESNTIGSKANDASISAQSVFLKELVENLREQIQNIE